MLTQHPVMNLERLIHITKQLHRSTLHLLPLEKETVARYAMPRA